MHHTVRFYNKGVWNSVSIHKHHIMHEIKRSPTKNHQYGASSKVNIHNIICHINTIILIYMQWDSEKLIKLSWFATIDNEQSDSLLPYQMLPINRSHYPACSHYYSILLAREVYHSLCTYQVLYHVSPFGPHLSHKVIDIQIIFLLQSLHHCINGNECASSTHTSTVKEQTNIMYNMHLHVRTVQAHTHTHSPIPTPTTTLMLTPTPTTTLTPTLTHTTTLMPTPTPTITLMPTPTPTATLTPTSTPYSYTPAMDQ